MGEKEEIEIKYKKSFVAFLDVLGFKEIIKQGKLDKLNIYFNEVNRIVDYLKKLINDIECIVISDSIIISVPFDEKNNFKRLNKLCDGIMLLQYHLIKKDIWIRGAISFGDTYCKNNQIVGQGYINAYLLEQEAIYPRVILDSKIIYELECKNSLGFIKSINNYNYTKHNYKGYDRTNVIYNYKGNTHNYLEQDVPLFVNYLDYFDENEIEILIEYLRNNMYKNNSLYKKFKWVSSYLLSYIENLESGKLKKYLDEVKSL